MDQIKQWALGELRNFLSYLEDEEIKQLLNNLINKDAASINQELSNLLDFTNTAQRKFINSFLERIANHRQYESQVKTLTQKTNKLAKDEVTGQRVNTQRITKPVKDISKFLVAGRKACHCQATSHNLINNCVSCGKIVCEQEGEGPCLFCGAWVEKGEVYYDLGEDEADQNSTDLRQQYEIALNHKDKLIEFDVNAAQRLGVLDAQSDWYDLANNTWLNKDQRKYALQMQEIEKKRQEEIDSKMNITMDLDKGTTNLKIEEEDKLFTFGQQNIQTNEFLQKTAGANKIKAAGGRYKPFEGVDDPHQLTTTDLLTNPQKALDNINSFYFKPCTLSDEKSLKLYQGLQPDYKKEIQGDSKFNPSSKTNKKVQQEREEQQMEEEKQNKIEESAKSRFMMSSLSKRLQTENPFDEFRKAVESAVLTKAVKTTNKVFEGDKDYYKEADDQGMCLSMHQPWASLLVLGFKRFEGREWTHKYRGPLWIHATSTKPTQELIDQIEGNYKKFYKQIGEDLPPFPDRYITSQLIGRLDLVDIISLEEYRDTVPPILQEPTESEYQFVCRNPQFLELPLKMSGQPGIYKMDKALFFGVKDLLIKAPVSWWPPEEYKLYSLGRFDLYPVQLAKIQQQQQKGKIEAKSVQVVKTNMGCFHVQNLLSLKEQQQILESSENQANSILRNKKKFDCYVMEVSGKDVSEEVKSLALSVEEGVNQIKDQKVKMPTLRRSNYIYLIKNHQQVELRKRVRINHSLILS
eukprot:403373797